MPIVFEEVSAEVATERPANADMQGQAPQPEENLREKLEAELALMRERQSRLFAD
jgi:hypothetical protein